MMRINAAAAALCILALGLACAISQAVPPEETTRDNLEKPVKAYIKACRSGDEKELQKTMSSFAYSRLKNNMASMGQALSPEMIRQFAGELADLFTPGSKWKFEKVLANGPTAALVYSNDSDQEGYDKPHMDFMALKCVKERGEWRYEGGMTTGADKFKADGKPTVFDTTLLPPELAIDGNVRQALAPAAMVDLVGMAMIESTGYRTEIAVNGGEPIVKENGDKGALIKEGLKKGKNTIDITFKKLAPDAAFKPRVEVHIQKPDGESVQAFKFAPQDKIDGRHSFTFNAD